MNHIKQPAYTSTYGQAIPRKDKNKATGTRETAVNLQEAKKDERQHS